MKNSIVVVALALAAAGAAYADDPTIDPYATAVSTRTRADVQAELAQARRDGSSNVFSIGYNPLTMTQPVKTRTRVLRELDTAQASGQLRAFGGEDSGSAYLAAPSVRPAITSVRVLAGNSSGMQWGR